MNRIVLGPIIGTVTHKKAKIWIFSSSDEGSRAIPYCHVKNRETAHFVPGSPFVFEPVSRSPSRSGGETQGAYVAEIEFPDTGEEFGFDVNYDKFIEPAILNYRIGRFPEEGDVDFSFGLISCHKPRNGKLKRIDDMWGMLADKMGDKDSRFLIQAGDQVYCDSDSFTLNAWKRSLELLQGPPTPGQDPHRKMVDFYREVYLDSWGFAPVQKVMSSFPQFMIWDDHEITDGWGSKAEHFEETRQKVFLAAKEAYAEFQHSHNPEPLRAGGMSYAFRFGAAAFLVLDLRGERNRPEKRLMSEDQWEAIENWLGSEEGKVLFLVSSVPVVHVSREMMSLAKLAALLVKDVDDDVADQWSFEHNKTARWRLIKLLMGWSARNGNAPVVILGGDVHVGTEAMMTKAGSDNRIFQVTSSPITNNIARVLDFFSAPFSSRFRFRLDEQGTERMQAEVKRRHRKRNFAIIEVKYDSGQPKLKLNMYRQGETDPKIWEFPS
jgi:alkaline phosphatase D